MLQTLIAFLVLAPATTPRPCPPDACGWSRVPFVALGTISFGIYVWHRPVITWLAERALVRDLGLDSGVGLFIVALLVTIPLSIVSWRLVERPTIRLSRRLGRDGFRGRDETARPPPVATGSIDGRRLALVSPASRSSRSPLRCRVTRCS